MTNDIITAAFVALRLKCAAFDSVCEAGWRPRRQHSSVPRDSSQRPDRMCTGVGIYGGVKRICD